jgi:electron transport complex protein RnfC
MIPKTLPRAGAWGLKLPSEKDNSALPPAREIKVPDTLTIVLRQSAGVASVPLVEAGEPVLKGQTIATPASTGLGSYLHSPVAGHVLAVETGDSKDTATAIVISNDRSERWHPDCQPVTSPLNRSPRFLREKIAAGGIVGLGGALFPTAVKLNPAPGIKTLIINGVECEPYINCDNQLLQEQPEAVLSGAQIMLQVLGASEAVVAIEQEMTHAIDCMVTANKALNDPRISIVVVPDIYPGGGERQLIETLTGLQVPSGGLPADLGIVCQNAGTAAAIDHLMTRGEPLISRLVTVAGNCSAAPANFRVRIGTSVNTLIMAVANTPPTTIVMGGAMMGIPVADPVQPVTKATNCLLLLNNKALTPLPTEMPCIRCGDCVPVCPAGINPQLLLESTVMRNVEQSEQLGALDCIDCGCCDYVCPSGIDLTARFKLSKQTIWEQHLLALRAERSEHRFAGHETRRRDKERAERERLDAQTAEFKDVGTDSKAALDAMLQRLKSDDNENGPDKDRD